jgi:phosphoserine phosphatase
MKLHVSKLSKILSDFTFSPHAPRVISSLKRRGYKVAAISAGLDILTENVSSTLGLDEALANGVAVDQQGYLTGEGIFRVDLKRKDIREDREKQRSQ